MKVDNGRVDGTIERVDERWVVRAIRHFRDDVRKVEFYSTPLEDMHRLELKEGEEGEHTIMVQVLAHSHVAVASGRDVKVSLHLVQVQASKHAAAVRLSLGPRSLCPPGPPLGESNNIMNMLFAKALVVFRVPANTRVQLAILVLAELVHALFINPLAPGGGLASQLVRSKNAISRGILDVDVQIVAVHLDDDVEIDLHVVPDAPFNSKRMGLDPAPPAAQLSPHENAGDEEHGNSPLSTTRRLRHILRLGFSCRMLAGRKQKMELEAGVCSHTECIKGADDAGLCAKVVLVQAMLLEVVHFR